MKQIEISFPLNSIKSEVALSSSKSESNRALIIKALSNNPIELSNLSDARDTQTMQSLLNNRPEVWDVLDAGTTMRFCTAYLSLSAKNKVITGSARMKERPIGVLVDSLNKLGADISYIDKEGFPPLRINKIEHQKADSLKIPGNISSQYISALLMIAPKLPQGLKIEFTSEVFSKPYIRMTLELMKKFGVESVWNENIIEVEKQEYSEGYYEIESDWSGTSYWYSLVSIAINSEISLRGLRKNSFQGDSAIATIMSKMGVSTFYEENNTLIKSNDITKSKLELDFKACPDLAQTVMVSAAVNGIQLKMTGLESLKIKETDRVQAMKNELLKLNAKLIEDNGVWNLHPGSLPSKIEAIDTYEDHRMAMSFAPLGVKMPIIINNPDVVNKSYPGFWNELKKVGATIKYL